MKLLDKMVLRELISPLIFGVAAFTSVFFAGTYILKITEWIMNGMPVLTALEIAVLVLPDTLKYTLPMATLLAVLLGVGRLSADSEIVSMFACGISIYRISIPIIGMGIVLSGCSILFNEFVGPISYERVEALKRVALKSENSANKPFTLYDDKTGTLLHVNGALDADKGIVSDVTIIKFDSARPSAAVYAKRADWAGLLDEKQKFVWKLHDGFSQNLGSDSAAIGFFKESETREVKLTTTPKQMSLLVELAKTRYTDQLSFAKLTKILELLKKHPDRPLKDIRKLEVDRWNRIALPLSSLIFAMIAAPLGIKPQRGSSSVGLGLSVLLILLYYIAWNYGCNVATNGTLPPFAGAFAGNALGIVAAIFLMRRSAK
jgi:lipopolysaccharide export system permease protein